MAILKKSIAIAAVFGFLSGCGGTNTAVERVNIPEPNRCSTQKTTVDPATNERVSLSVCSHIATFADGASILMHNNSCKVGKIVDNGYSGRSKITKCL